MFRGNLKIVVELHTRFSQKRMNKVLNFVYPHYWLLEKCDESFNTHINVVLALFYTLKKMGIVETVVITMVKVSHLQA
jgi:hypothetical protein